MLPGCQGVSILVGRASILKTRMLAQMCKNIRESQENIGAAFGRAPPGRGAPRRLFSSAPGAKNCQKTKKWPNTENCFFFLVVPFLS